MKRDWIERIIAVGIVLIILAVLGFLVYQGATATELQNDFNKGCANVCANDKMTYITYFHTNAITLKLNGKCYCTKEVPYKYGKELENREVKDK